MNLKARSYTSVPAEERNKQHNILIMMEVLKFQRVHNPKTTQNILQAVESIVISFIAFLYSNYLFVRL